MRFNTAGTILAKRTAHMLDTQRYSPRGYLVVRGRWVCMVMMTMMMCLCVCVFVFLCLFRSVNVSAPTHLQVNCMRIEAEQRSKFACAPRSGQTKLTSQPNLSSHVD